MNPLGIGLAVTFTLIFQVALIGGEEFAGGGFPEFENPTVTEECLVSGVITAIGCGLSEVASWIGNFFSRLMWLLRCIWVGILFVTNYAFFNVEGAPWQVRAIMTVVNSGGIGLFVVSLVRGVKSPGT